MCAGSASRYALFAQALVFKKSASRTGLSRGRGEFGADAEDASRLPVDLATRRRLAFDHVRILKDGVERTPSKLEC